jgi:SNF2 family DNA or RNA helicase
VIVAELDPDVRSVAFSAAWNEYEVIKKIPGVHWSSDHRRWELDATWAGYCTLVGTVTNVEIGPLLKSWAENEWSTRVEPALLLRSMTEWPAEWPDPGFDARLRSYQRVAVYMALLAGDGYVYGDEMSGGKGVQALCAWRMLHQRGQDVLRGLVVCPNNAKRHWAKEITKWFPEATPYIVPSGAVQRKKVISAAERDPTAIIIVNYDAMRLLSRLETFGNVAMRKCRSCAPRDGDPKVKSGTCETHLKQLNYVPIRLVIFDEIHHLKDPRAKQTRACWYVAHQQGVRIRWGTTGTMMADHIGDTWSIMHTLLPREYQSRSKWMDMFALQAWNSHGGLDVVGLRPDTRDTFFQFFDPRYRRVTLALVEPQIPPTIHVVREVSMPQAQERMYRELEKTLASFTPEGDLIVAQNNLVVQTRLMQAAAAGLEIDKGDNPDDVSSWKVHLKEPSPKLDELDEIFEELEIWPNRIIRPVVIMGVYVDLLELAYERLTKRGYRVKLATGKQSEKERWDAAEAMDRNEIHALIGSIDANTEAVNFAHVDDMIMLQRHWSLIKQLQVQARHSPARRNDARRYQAARIIHVVTADTVEDNQTKRLIAKLERLEELNRDREALLRAGRSVEDVERAVQMIQSSTIWSP